MNSSHQKVRVWLEKMFASEAIPVFEINTETIKILTDLMEVNEQNDRNSKLIIEDFKQKTLEYSSEADRLEGIMSSVGLPLASLSQSGATSVRSLANTALQLCLNDTKLSSYYLGLQSLSKEVQCTNEEQMKTRHANQKLLRKTKNALVKYDALTKACESLEEQMMIQEPILSKHSTETGFLHRKAEEYQKQIQELQAYQRQIKLDPEIYHSTLMKKYEALVQLQEELKPLKSKLDTYHSLPPDISLAKVKVEEAKRELMAMEEQLTKNINSMQNA